MSNIRDRKSSMRAAEQRHVMIQLLISVVAILLIVIMGFTAYHYAYAVFDEEAVAKAPGTDVEVTVPDNPTDKQVGKILKENGLIENVQVFRLQARFSAYHDTMKGGTYLLNTSQTPTEMMEILAGVNTEGQPSQTKEEAESEAAGGESGS